MARWELIAPRYRRLRGRKGDEAQPRWFGLGVMFPRTVVGIGSDDDPVVMGGGSKRDPFSRHCSPPGTGAETRSGTGVRLWNRARSRRPAPVRMMPRGHRGVQCRGRRRAEWRRRADSDHRFRDGWHLPMRTALCCVVTWVLSASLAGRAEGQVPGRPLNGTSTADGDSAIVLSWDAPSDTGGSAITGYRIRLYDPAIAAWTLLANTNASTTTYRHTGLKASTGYVHGIRAVNASGFSARTAVVFSGTGGAAGTPGAPASLTSTVDGDSAIDLSWTAPTDTGTSAVIGYRIEYWFLRNADGAPTVLIANTNSTTTTHRHSAIVAGSYLHHVSAINSSGAGAPKTKLTSVNLDRPQSPENLTPRRIRIRRSTCLGMRHI